MVHKLLITKDKMGSMNMENKILIMKEKLDNILNYESINSERVLHLSQELDKVILKYYQNQKG